MIYQAQDKRLNLAAMRRFRRALDAMVVEELYLHGRLYTWSNERRRPTLERIDRAFATIPWLEAFPDRRLRALSSDCSDHAPVLLELRTEHRASPRFRFEPFWARMEGFLETVH
jgi:endonuclease/exonuclease/phosphatase family metal-dependent hydrolase